MTATEWWLLAVAGFAFGRWMDCLLRLRRLQQTSLDSEPMPTTGSPPPELQVSESPIEINKLSLKIEKNMKRRAVIGRVKSDIEESIRDDFCIWVPSIRDNRFLWIPDGDFIGAGKTVSDAKESLKKSVDEEIAEYIEAGEAVPKELYNIEFEYQYDVRSTFIRYDFIDILRFARWAGIEMVFLRDFETDETYLVSEVQAEQLVEALHRLGEKLSAIAW